MLLLVPHTYMCLSFITCFPLFDGIWKSKTIDNDRGNYTWFGCSCRCWKSKRMRKRQRSVLFSHPPLIFGDFIHFNFENFIEKKIQFFLVILYFNNILFIPQLLVLVCFLLACEPFSEWTKSKFPTTLPLHPLLFFFFFKY